ncbi:MAG TPA: hypothetical protein VNT75_13705 [Symbiobacteriaceae bacterium]|nr:hypothetical protein [Symbiobacteriaceae bacterium]
MRKTWLLLLIATVLLSGGCRTAPKTAPPSVPQAPEQAYRPPETPAAGQTAITPMDGGWMVRQVHPAGYLWREDGGAIAFRTEAGLMSATADGRTLQQVAAGPADQELVRYTADGLLYVERGPGGIALVRWQPASGAKAVAQLAPAGAPNALWHGLAGDRLVFARPDKTISTVDLKTGKISDLGGEPVDIINGEFAISKDGRYLTYKLANRGDALRVIDLQTGVRIPNTELHLAGAVWSPVETRWAVRAAEPGSGLPRPGGANLEEGATHLDVGAPVGEVRHLRPPEQAVLTAGPWWSPDGKRLAVMAEPPAERQPGPVWVVEVTTDQWTKLQPSEPFWVTGWTPDGRFLTTQTAGIRLPVDGGALVKRDDLIEQVTLPDGSTVDLKKDGAVTHRGTQLLAPDPGLRERLTVSGSHAALFMTRAGAPIDLLVLNLK